MIWKKHKGNSANGTEQRPPEPSVGPSPCATAAAQPRLHLAILVASCVAAYSACLGHQFLGWDDTTHILENSLVNPPVLANLPRAWAQGTFGLYIPLTYNAWTLLAMVSNALLDVIHPAVFHAANLLAHIVNALLVYRLVGRIGDLAAERGRPAIGPTAVLMGALLFAVHPLQVQPVVWISGLRDTLSAGFGLAALLLHYRLAQLTGGYRPWRQHRGRHLLVCALFAAAILCKPTAIALLLVVVVIDRWLIGLDWRFTIGTAAPWLAAAIPVAIATKALQPTSSMIVYTPLLQRPVVALDALAFYLGKLVAPLSLLPDYGRTPAALFVSPAVYWTWIVPVAAAGAVLVLRRRAPYLAGGCLAATAALAPVFGVIPFPFQDYSTVSDQYMYLPLVGLAIAVAGSLRGRTALAIATVALLALGARSFAQTLLWKDDVTLFTHVVAENSRSYAGHNTVARAYSFRGEHELALDHYKKALAIEPANPISLINVGEAMNRMGAHQNAVTHYDLVFSTHTPQGGNVPMFALMRTNKAAALFELGKIEDALRELDVALELDPTSAAAIYTKGAILYNSGRMHEAIPWLERAVRNEPFNERFRKNLDAARAAVGSR
jgi:tetratricopeptide (TPR) repeat protein